MTWIKARATCEDVSMREPDMEQRVQALSPAILRGLRRGIEKEGLRVRPDGTLATTPHPAGLGSALTHPRITTDFSESQLELITGVHDDIEACLAELAELHQVVYRSLDDELVWGASLPCKLPADERIPIGRYGSSNLGGMKHVYRLGLAHRYGRRMQAVSGIHYNFSLPGEAWPALHAFEASSDSLEMYPDVRYMGLIRNFRRHGWLLILLLGSSPAACASFVANRPHALQAWGTGTLFGPGATSLRMGRLGYQSEAQSELAVSFNDLAGYAAALERAMRVPYPPYEAIGLEEGGEFRQLSTALLQIENEFYGTIRPKRTIERGERPLRALGDRGIEYVEVRCLDVDPFEPVGIDADAIRLIDVFLLHCLLADSPADSPAEIRVDAVNQRAVAEAGRDPATRLDRAGEQVAPAEWGSALLLQCEPIAAALDRAFGGADYGRVLRASQAGLVNPDTLPSARVLRAVERDHGRSFPDFVLAQSRRHRDALSRLPLAPAARQRYEALAAESLAEQHRMEAADDVPFDEYRRRYLEQPLLSGRHFGPTGDGAEAGAGE
jgi:glutamate--cysteine ligase